MAKLQKEFCTFHDAIKIGTYEENKTLREKRDLLIDDLRDKLKDEKVPGTDKSLTFKKLDQGSYAMNTGIKPKNDDYDIDVGMIFDITNDEYNSHKLKQLIYDKLNSQNNRTVEFNRPCITVKYSDGYHVDLAIYSENSDDIHIAWGKKHSAIKEWHKSEPKELKTWVSDVSDDTTEREQFRRCVRYLKKWKERKFTSDGNFAPPSIGLTIQVRNAFIYREENDLDALIDIVNTMMDEFILDYDDDWNQVNTIEAHLPVAPFKDVYYKMTKNQEDAFYNKLEALSEALEAAKNCDSDSEASKILRKIFGDDFPEVEDVITSNVKPVSEPGFNA